MGAIQGLLSVTLEPLMKGDWPKIWTPLLPFTDAVWPTVYLQHFLFIPLLFWLLVLLLSASNFKMNFATRICTITNDCSIWKGEIVMSKVNTSCWFGGDFCLETHSWSVAPTATYCIVTLVRCTLALKSIRMKSVDWFSEEVHNSTLRIVILGIKTHCSAHCSSWSCNKFCPCPKF